MNLEDRLRAELERSSRSARVGTAPSVDELATVATSRRARNRVVGSAGAVAISATLLIAAFVATQPDDNTLIVVAEDTSVVADADEVAPTSGDADNEAVDSEAVDSESSASVELPALDDADLEELDPDVERIPIDTNDDASETAKVDDSQDEPPVVGGPVLSNALQGDEGSLNVSSRESAVDFAGGSGVLVVADDAGFRGIATKFDDNGAVQIGLSSANGLDWSETQLVGVPQGATASILRPFDDGHVALFSRFDADAQQRQTFVGMSTDLVVWDMSDPLPGDGIATDLAVGSSGVIIIGDEFDPSVWLGPVGGPFELTARLDAGMLFGVTTLGDNFLVAGRSADFGVTLFSSTDGVRWGARQLSSPDVGAATQSVAIADGTIVLTTTNEQGVVTLVSSNGGASWDRLGDGELRSISVSGSALGFLGGNGANPTVTLSDGESFASAVLDVSGPDRLALLTTTSDQAVMLVQTNGGGLTWLVASR